MSSDVDQPMGNAELRLTLASLENEIGDVKGLSLDIHEQTKKTNGRVNLLMKVAWMAGGALPLLTFWAAWLTYQQLYPPHPQISQQEMQAAFNQVLQENIVRN